MHIIRQGVLLGAVAFTLFAGTPRAQAVDQPAPTSAQQSSIDPDRLQLARQIVAQAWPEDRREDMMDNLLKTFMGQYLASVPMDKFKDAGLRKIIKDNIAEIPAILSPSVKSFLPKQMEAIAHAYARRFDRKTLEDVLVFSKTPSGVNFLQHSSEVLSDPDVAAANTEYLKQIQMLAQKFSERQKQRVDAYLQAHPEAIPKSGS